MIPYFHLLTAIILIFSCVITSDVRAQNVISDNPGTDKNKSAAVRAVHKMVGDNAFNELLVRLKKTNSDIRLKGIKTIEGQPNAGGSFLTGYPYTEFYDWDLYFENLYLGYYGISKYCYTNLKEFLRRQEADGYINRSLHRQRDRQHFKPFLAQLVVLGGRQDNNEYTWLNSTPDSARVVENGSYCLFLYPSNGLVMTGPQDAIIKLTL